MTIDEAARTLDRRARGAPWYTAVGVGEHGGAPALFLYVKAVRPAELAFVRGGWEGYPVEVRRSGTPRPLPA